MSGEELSSYTGIHIDDFLKYGFDAPERRFYYRDPYNKYMEGRHKYDGSYRAEMMEKERKKTFTERGGEAKGT